ncbi:hypothetical protein RSAG8_09227, partial [Rhizoctonia solani AG-8 WAC10335]
MLCKRTNHILARQLRRAISSPLGGGLYNKDGTHKDIATWAAMDGSQNWGTINPLELQQWAPIDESPLWDMKDLSNPNKGNWEEALDPTAILDYIPMSERWACYWLGRRTLKCKKQGYLQWVGSSPPNGEEEMQRTKFFVCQGNVGMMVEAMVHAPKVKHAKDIGEWHLEKSDNEDDGWLMDMTSISPWVDRQVQAWKDQVPEGLGGYVDDYLPEEVYQMILEWKFGINDLYDWLKWRESKLPEWELGSSMAELILKED